MSEPTAGDVGLKLKVHITIGDEEPYALLVPMASFVAYHDTFGEWPSDTMGSGAPLQAWVPWLAWHAHTLRRGVTETFDEWLPSVDWIEAELVPTANPSGGAPTSTLNGSPQPSTSTPSPKQSPGRTSATTSSSRSRTPSKKPSGVK